MRIKTAFNLNLMVITFFIANAIFFNILLFYVVAFVFVTLLPACSRTK